MVTLSENNIVGTKMEPLKESETYKFSLWFKHAFDVRQ